LKTVFILFPVLVPFFPGHSTHAGLSPPHKRAFSLFNREKGARGGNGWKKKKTIKKTMNRNKERDFKIKIMFKNLNNMVKLSTKTLRM
jgi:hypothetical protein